MRDCLFCRIISRKAKAHIVYENEHVCCFLDKYPINQGHVLVVPKRHFLELRDADPLSLVEVMLAAQKIAVSLEKVLDTDGSTIFQENGAFKDVDHFHLHVVPRFLDDGFSWIEPDIRLEEIDFNSLQHKISMFGENDPNI